MRANIAPQSQTVSHGRFASGSEPALDEIWREYKATGSSTLRNVLIIHYMNGHVRQIAQRLHAQLPPQVEIDDLVDEAYEGLVDVIERLDLDKDVRFETFSSKRLYGAMRDYLRRIDPIPRLTRTRSKHAQALIESFHKRFGRAPDEHELSRLFVKSAKARFRRINRREPDPAELVQVLRSAKASFRRTMREGRPALTVTFSGAGGEQSPSTSKAANSGGDEQGDAMANFEDRHDHSPLSRAEMLDLRRWITRDFSRRDRLIIVLYYYEQMTMREIGLTLGCSESRVSQRLELILNSLKARLYRTGGEREFYRK